MAFQTPASPILQLIHRTIEGAQVRELPDQDLLERFRAKEDKSAFHALLRRHGPMVLDVCRGVLGNEADAEDAFQATFLILARKAGSIRKAASLASWLHGVACRTALTARTESAARQKHEARVPAREASGPEDLSWREVRQVLHEELASLHDRYRAPLVLCYLEGVTQEAAAAQLKLAKSTLRERLERGRVLLRTRLLRRGLGPAAVLVTAAWPAVNASAGLPLSVVSNTINAACLFAVGKAAVPGMISAKAAALTEGALKAMFLGKLKIIAAVLVLLAAVAAGATGFLQQSPAAAEPPARKAETRSISDPEKSSGEPKPLVIHQDAVVHRVAWTPKSDSLATVGLTFDVVDFKDANGNNTGAGALWPSSTINLWDARTGKLRCRLSDEKHTYVTALAFSLDEDTAAVTVSVHFEDPAKRGETSYRLEAWLLDAESGRVTHRFPLDGFATELAFSPDGTRVALGGKKGNGSFVEIWDACRHRRIGGTTEKLPAPDAENRVTCLAFAHDGKLLAAGETSGIVRLFDGKTGALIQTLEGHREWVSGVGFSPDGKTLISASTDTTVRLWDVAAGKLRRTLRGNEAPVTAFACSPDGRFFATTGEVKKDGQSVIEAILWDAKTGKPTKTLTDLTTPIKSLAFSPDGAMLALGGGVADYPKPGRDFAITTGGAALFRVPPTSANSEPQDEQPKSATQLALQAHAQAAAFDKLPRFSYWVRTRHGIVNSMRAVDASPETLKQALTAEVLKEDWLGWYETVLAWDEKRFIREILPAESNLNYNFRFWTADEGWDRAEAQDKSSRNFTRMSGPQKMWDVPDHPAGTLINLFDLGYLRLTPHNYRWGRTVPRTCHQMTPRAPEKATWQHAGVEKFGDETCDVVESNGAGGARLWISQKSGRVRGLLTYPFERPEPNELVQFDDYREVAPGVWLPYREIRSFPQASETPGKHVLRRSELVVKEVRTDRDLAGRYAELLPKDGDRIQDQR